MQIIQRMGKVPVLVIDGILNIIFYLINCINKEALAWTLSLLDSVDFNNSAVTA